ncbi:PREDICTED: uncharacterized protein LOC101363593 [Odobenus rosmarus divergens]|uniref:Uncharacterized protein LOC101363593 n=1 Tax=Odobenus rosmarus divergens TaxID=9708 RepID=A0A9B0HCF5_ODORO
MAPGLLHCVAFCLLGAGHMGAMVIQSPRYQVTWVGRPVNLSCSQDLNHYSMYWYQQKLSQAPKLLLYYYGTDLNREADTSDNFQSSRPNTSFCSLSILLPSPGDSALYLCASRKNKPLLAMGCLLQRMELCPRLNSEEHPEIPTKQWLIRSPRMVINSITCFQLFNQEAKKYYPRSHLSNTAKTVGFCEVITSQSSWLWGVENASEKTGCLCSFTNAVMGPVFICSLVLWLLSAGTLDAEVTQTPGHLVKGKGQKAEMHCVPIKGHRYVFWYQQIPAKEFKFLTSFQDDIISDKTGMPEKRFLAVCPRNSPCSLEIKSTELQDSAVCRLLARAFTPYDSEFSSLKLETCTTCSPRFDMRMTQDISPHFPHTWDHQGLLWKTCRYHLAITEQTVNVDNTDPGKIWLEGAV